MKTLCITGMSEPDLLQIGERFYQAGMTRPRSTERGHDLNIKEWHNRFWGNAAEDVPVENRPLPGKFGEQLASEIFFANMDAPLWGWHDSRSTWMLDFWADFDPRLMFLLVCSPLDYQLARIMETESSRPFCVDEVVTTWKHSHEQLLQFYHRFPERCLLVDVCDCSTQFEVLAQSCHAKWDLPLVVTSEETGEHFSPPDSLTRYLAANFLNNQPEATSLWNELTATLTNFSSSTDTDTHSLQMSDIIASFRTLRDRSEEHQLQEKLESMLLQKAEVAAERDQHKQQISDLQTKLTQTSKQFDALGKEKQEVEKKLKTEIEQLKKANVDTTASQDKFKADITNHVQQVRFLKNQQRETSEENELLLLQLHQVQEELEHYFLKHQEISTQHDQAEARWQRMLQRQPDYYDYHTLTVTPGDNPSSLIWQISNLEIGSRSFPDLQFETFVLDGISGFRFTRPGKDTVFATSPLLRWPLEIEDSGQIDLIPVAENNPDANRRINSLKGLTASDWSLLQYLALFLKARLQDTAVEADLPAALRTETITGFDRFLEVIANFPISLRYDRITLEQENCSEDSEQLQLAIENLSHGKHQFPRFDFRLSCAGLHSSDFGNHPRLEFPADMNIVLKSWFDNSNDPEDPRLELRFALPDAMDLDVWHKLSDTDAEFIRMLVQHLPLMLDDLHNSDLSLNRSWDQWLSLSNDVKEILQLRAAPIEAEEVS